MFVLLFHCFTVPYLLHVIVTKVKEMAGNPCLTGTVCSAVPLSGKLKDKKKVHDSKTIEIM